MPGILNQLGPDSLATLRQLAESLQSKQGAEAAGSGEKSGDDEDVPDLVENFDEEKQD